MLGADNPLVKQILAGKTPKATGRGARRRHEDGRCRRPARRCSPAARRRSTASKDPFIELARLVDPRARELRTKYDNEVLGVERDAYSKIAQAVFAIAGRRGLSRRHLHAAPVVRPGEGLHGERQAGDAVHRDPRPLHPRRRAQAEAALQDRRLVDEGARDASIRPRPSTSSAPTTSSAATADRR